MDTATKRRRPWRGRLLVAVLAALLGCSFALGCPGSGDKKSQRKSRVERSKKKKPTTPVKTMGIKSSTTPMAVSRPIQWAPPRLSRAKNQTTAMVASPATTGSLSGAKKTER